MGRHAGRIVSQGSLGKVSTLFKFRLFPLAATAYQKFFVYASLISVQEVVP